MIHHLFAACGKADDDVIYVYPFVGNHEIVARLFKQIIVTLRATAALLIIVNHHVLQLVVQCAS